jgi:2,4-dienoyl-CoA reductase-like NADH-dependent reductase (Old Yellow Enzyme family)
MPGKPAGWCGRLGQRRDRRAGQVVSAVAAAEVFEPARLGPAELRNRVIKAATFEGMTPHGLVTDELIEFHRRFARGGVGMTTVAYCAVSPEGRTDRHQIWMRPDAVPGLGRLAETVHAEGAAISAQIGHAGPVANPASNRLAALGPSVGQARLACG